jgi:son of sevenless-like protein
LTTHKGKTIIKGATLEKLTEKLYEQTVGSDFITEYVDTFLLTYRSFTSSKTLFTLITGSYPTIDIEAYFPSYFQQQQDEEKAKSRKLRICNFLKRWLDNHYYDFEDDTELSQLFDKFIGRLSASSEDIVINVLRKAQGKAVSCLYMT